MASVPATASDPVLDQLKPQVEQLLLLLSQKEKFVIQRRFNLDEKSRATLEEIGQHFQVTRERVRQIERNALQKLRRNIENTQLFNIDKLAYQFLQEAGGLMKEDLLVSRILGGQKGFSYSAVQLIVSLDKRFERLPNTVHYHPYVKFKTMPEQFIRSVTDQTIKILSETSVVTRISALASQLKKMTPEDHLVIPETLASVYQINKNFKLVGSEAVGLMKWRHVNPRTIRDKIFFVLREKGKPLHFVDIANGIVASQFDRKTLNHQAIHNELIRNDEFVLIGRGIYALKEWGFNIGTVADIITSILRKNGSMSQDAIIAEVLKQRQVKPITIILNLKGKNAFVRLGRTQYALREKA
jgi:DNA-binding CsgD family transcriptional regulator